MLTQIKDLSNHPLKDKKFIYNQHDDSENYYRKWTEIIHTMFKFVQIKI